MDHIDPAEALQLEIATLQKQLKIKEALLADIKQNSTTVRGHLQKNIVQIVLRIHILLSFVLGSFNR